MYNFQNIPDELKRLPQWVVWKYEQTDDGKQTKILYNPLGGWRASTVDARTWVDFNTAVQAYETSQSVYAGIGFVFTNFDEYCGIDLDSTEDQEAYARQVKVYEALNSYSELSPSGKGLHIIVKATIPHGRKRSFIEVYSWGRFFTFTGNVFGGQRPIEDRQEIVTRLWEELGNGANVEAANGEMLRPDFNDNIIQRAASASNGALFQMLFNGNWQSNYPSQSEADQALMNIIVFYTKNKEQAFEIFRASGLGQRDKAQRDKYLDYTFTRAYDMTLPPIDVSVLLSNINNQIAANKPAQPVQIRMNDEPALDLDMWKREPPPGLMGAMVDYFMQQSQLPVYEISLAAALGLMAGICGRSYNINRSGLNLYIMLLAGTGRGKDAMKTGIGSLVAAVSKQGVEGQRLDAAFDFLGPRNAVSGPGLIKHLAKAAIPSYVSLTGEVGKRFRQLTDKNANSADKTFTTALLDLYTAASAGEMFMGTSYSQEKDSIGNILAPAFTWLGEGEPIGFYETLSDSNISEGLIPRFIIIEYSGPRAEDNDNMHHSSPSPQLIEQTKQLMMLSLTNNQQQIVIVPKFADHAEALHKRYRKYCRNKMDELEGTPVGQLWNRAHLNILRVSALLAIAHNMHEPVITTKMIDWAASLVITNSVRLTDKFNRGTIGGGDMQKALAKLAKVVVGFYNGGIGQINSGEAKCVQNAAISRSMLSRNVLTNHPFKEDKNMLSTAISELVKFGVLHQLHMEGSKAEVYQISDMSWFVEQAKS